MTRPDMSKVDPNVAKYITSLEERLVNLEQMMENLQRMHFGRRNEQIKFIPSASDGQISIFDSDRPTVPPTAPEEPEEIEIAAHKRKKKRTQEESLCNLPTVRHDIEPLQAEQSCPYCGNAMTEWVPVLAYKEIEFVAPQLVMHEYYTRKYICRCREQEAEICESCDHASIEECKSCEHRTRTFFVAADIPEEYRHPLIPGSLVSVSAAVQIIYAKYGQATPLYRQEKDWERLGWKLSRATMSNWVVRFDQMYFQPVVKYLRKRLLETADIIHCDETPLKVLSEKTKNGGPRRSYIWVFRAAEAIIIPIVIYEYNPSRAGEVATSFLEGYEHYFVSDAYSGYNGLGRQAIRCGCWAHTRRGFYDAIPGHDMNKESTGREGVRFCDALFRIEEKTAALSTEERLNVRKGESRRVMDDFYAWMDTLEPGTKALKDAINYARKQKEALGRFLEDGRIPISNNAAENAIRPVVLGRKNWLFSNTDDGAQASADIFSIIETAKANGLDEYKYLTFLLNHVRMINSNLINDNLEPLMPWNSTVAAQCKRTVF